MPTSGEQPEFILRLRALPSRIQAPVRLRRLLKILKRVYGFQCVTVEEVSPDPSQAPPNASGASVDDYQCFCGLCDPLEGKGHRPRVPLD
jgi:hypothetical protein